MCANTWWQSFWKYNNAQVIIASLGIKIGMHKGYGTFHVIQAHEGITAIANVPTDKSKMILGSVNVSLHSVAIYHVPSYQRGTGQNVRAGYYNSGTKIECISRTRDKHLKFLVFCTNYIGAQTYWAGLQRKGG